MTDSRIASPGAAPPPLIAHVVHHLIMGGLENGLINLVNRIPPERYRHVIVCMSHFSDFRFRIRREDVPVLAMRVRERPRLQVAWDLIRLFRRLRPRIIHSRNLSGLDSLLPAAIAGVPSRIHGEHGWDVVDVEGRNRKHQWLRRAHAPLVHRYIALSRHQDRYLRERVGIAPSRITQIYNGVDVARFHPAEAGRIPLPFPEGMPEGALVVGTVGRMQPVKDPLNLVHAFLHARRAYPALRSRLRLAMIGDGPLHEPAVALLRQEGAWGAAWLPGPRDDVPELLRSLDLFVLPSRLEGISNTILEAMATGLPVIATSVGGNPELVVEDETGKLVPPSDPRALAEAMAAYANEPGLACAHGRAGRSRAVERFSIEEMVERYMAVYDECSRRGPASLAGADPAPAPR